MKLIACPETSEQCLVESLDGYEGWDVLSEDASPPPSAHCHWDRKKKRWLEDEEAKVRADKRAQVCDPDKLLARIEELEARIEALETRKD